jgi:glycogen synthase
MKILMLGWELPPIISGGLGVASEGIARGLAASGHQIDFLLPKKNKSHKSDLFQIIDASKIKPDLKLWKKKTKHLETIIETDMGMRLLPYLDPEIFTVAREKQIVIEHLEETEESILLEKVVLTGDYQQNLQNEITKYSLLAMQIAGKSDYEVIHAHDWITFRAGRMASFISGKPLFTHCHSTEYDRNGVNAQTEIILEEKQGFEDSKKIFCVSGALKKVIIEKYGIAASKIIVVPNAAEVSPRVESKKKSATKIVLFVGRFTHQKNPSTFVDIARDLVNRGIDAEFAMIGDGYLMGDLEHKVHHKNLTEKITFTGFLNQDAVLKALDNADLLIAPSASEPFGLVMLEAILKKVPVAAAEGVGLAEFVPSLPQTKPWDHYNYVRLAEKLLTDDALIQSTVEQCYSEAMSLSWQKSAKMIEKGY